MLVCGLLFPCLLTGLSALIFPHQADGNLLTVNGQTVGAEYVGQEFTEDYYMWSRPSAYHYNVYVEGEDGKLYYNDGTEFPGIGSGSNNYAATNPALTERVEADIKAFLEKNPGVKREDIPTDRLPPKYRSPGSLKRPGLQRKRSKISCRKIPRAKSLASLARRLSMCSKSISRSHSGWEFCDRGGRLWRRCTMESLNKSSAAGKRIFFPIHAE